MTPVKPEPIKLDQSKNFETAGTGGFFKSTKNKMNISLEGQKPNTFFEVALFLLLRSCIFSTKGLFLDISTAGQKYCFDL